MNLPGRPAAAVICAVALSLLAGPMPATHAAVVANGPEPLPSTAGRVLPEATVAGIRWRGCPPSMPDAAQCGRVTVPRDWGNPGTGSFQIAVARLRATGSQRQRKGILVFNPGGPGGSGRASLEGVGQLLPANVRASFDLVTWDPRGVGATTPSLAECTQTPTSPPDTGPVDWPTETANAQAAMSAALTTCLAANTELAPFLGTWQVVRDLDAIRKALGEKRLTFWGMSYGTTIGRTYAQTFPDRVRALVLDGAIDPRSTEGSYAREQMWATAHMWARVSAWLGRATRVAYARVMAALDQQVIMSGNQRITRWDLTNLILYTGASQNAWRYIDEAIERADRAIFAESAAQRRAGAASLRRLLRSIGLATKPSDEPVPLDPVLSFVNCADLPDRISGPALAAIVDQSVAVGGLLGGLATLGQATECAGMPSIGRPLTVTTGIRLQTPPIVINAIADPRTPWVGARMLANAFTGARMISYDSAEHVSWTIVRSDCVDDAVTSYVMTQRLPSKDLACPLSPPS